MQQQWTNEAKDVAVVGGGLAGLISAACLARSGRPVTLFEGGHLGGRASTQELNGFKFNFGPHALYRAGALWRVLEQLGVRVTGESPGSPGTVLRGGRRHLLPRDPESLLRTSLFNWRSRLEATSVFASLPRLDPTTLNHISVGEWIGNLRHPEVRQFLGAMIRLSTFSGDERQSMGAAAAQLQRGLAGVLYLDDGWASMVAELRRVARGEGADLREGSPVVAVEHEGAVRGVRLQDGSFHRAGAVILAVSPSNAARLVGRGTELDQWATSAIPVSLASLDIGLARLPHPETPFALGLDEPLYFSVHAPAARLAPKGGAVLHVAKYLAADYNSAGSIESELETLLDSMQPGWRNELVARRFLRHTIVSSLLPTAAMGGTAGRPGPEVSEIRNLYIAGDWVGKEGLLSDASAASAELACEMILNNTPSPSIRYHAFA